MSEWQPIETAPRDGTIFLAFGRLVGIRMVTWRNHWNQWQVVPGYHQAKWPTHWMPLPEMPQ
jgi:hypothetical protein